ncbi:OLC1v1007192C1 [Oldenlandia corymbosa var. corymbosa]|uniref:OLC1v1007192C1 n=1 Tax=Oldenlandia corymbosa var. corymbosa TaxID=529605 RepID=A0AAV1DM30_OLDCO|nr:OLC1v1007192C1 [Oldenlandia corymbosa var. corymbosa]
MFPTSMSNSTSLSEEASASSVTRVQDFATLNPMAAHSILSDHHHHHHHSQPPQKIKKKRNLPGNPDPDAEVIALSPKTLLATNRFVCEVCNKGFQRDQNLQLHRRGHNLPWKLKQRNNKENRKRAYVCPEPTCVHHHPSRALGDLTGIKKHYCRKHGEKKWKCEKCSKIYAVQSDWKAHSKTCGTREYRCDCGTLFSRKDSFVTHRAFCDALAEESARLSATQVHFSPPPSAAAATTDHQLLRPNSTPAPPPPPLYPFQLQQRPHFLNPLPWDFLPPQNPSPNQTHQLQNDNNIIKPETIHLPISSPFFQEQPPQPTATIASARLVRPPSLFQQTLNDPVHHSLSATALLQKAAALGSHSLGHVNSTMTHLDMTNIGNNPPEYPSFAPSGNLGAWHQNDRLTRDFLGLTGDHGQCGGGGGGGGGGSAINGNGNGNIDVNLNVNMRGVLSFTGSVEFPTYERDLSLLKPKSFGFVGEPPATAPETWRNS